jgi:signal peptidase
MSEMPDAHVAGCGSMPAPASRPSKNAGFSPSVDRYVNIADDGSPISFSGSGKVFSSSEECPTAGHRSAGTAGFDRTAFHAELMRYELSVTPKKRRAVFSAVSNALFYVAIIGAVLLVFVASGEMSGGPRMIGGYAYFVVLSGSMQKEIPVGALVITHRIDPNELQIGDNISFMKSANTTMTHKIIGIYEAYCSDGSRGFQTQGVNNPQPDKDMVEAANVVGKVILSVPGAGQALSVLSNNIILAILFFGLLLLLSFTLPLFFTLRKEERGKTRKSRGKHQKPRRKRRLNAHAQRCFLFASNSTSSLI